MYYHMNKLIGCIAISITLNSSSYAAFLNEKAAESSQSVLKSEPLVPVVIGTSIHTKLPSNNQQQQNAQVLLKKALWQFASNELELIHTEFIGTPQIKTGTTGNTILTYSILFSINEDAYKQAVLDLIPVLNKVASTKKQFIVETDAATKDRNDPKFYFDEKLQYRGSEKTANISVLTWIARNFASFNMLLYTIKGADTKQLNKIFRLPQLQGYLHLLDKNDKLLAAKQFDLSDIETMTPEYHSGYYIIRSYFLSYNGNIHGKPSILRNVSIAVANEDVPNIQSLELRLHRER